jgi:hypothetical protein
VERDITLSELVTSIDSGRPNGNGNLSSAIRLFVLDRYRNQPNDVGELPAPHELMRAGRLCSSVAAAPKSWIAESRESERALVLRLPAIERARTALA